MYKIKRYELWATVFENTFATTSIMVDDLVEMQLSCDNKTARAMILNNSVELNRKSSCDETGSIVAGVQRSSVVGVAWNRRGNDVA